MVFRLHAHAITCKTHTHIFTASMHIYHRLPFIFHVGGDDNGDGVLYVCSGCVCWCGWCVFVCMYVCVCIPGGGWGGFFELFDLFLSFDGGGLSYFNSFKSCLSGGGLSNNNNSFTFSLNVF